MDKKMKLIVIVIAFAVLIGGASVLYKNLGETYAPEQLAVAETEPAASSGTEPPRIAAPDFTVYDAEGNAVKLSDFFGKPIVLNFWASWCDPCRSEMPEIQDFYDQYGQDVQFILVSQDDSLEDAKAFIEDEGYSFPVYFDSTFMGSYSYGASSIPLTYFIDADGQMIAYFRGAMSESILQQGIDLIYVPEQA